MAGFSVEGMPTSDESRTSQAVVSVHLDLDTEHPGNANSKTYPHIHALLHGNSQPYLLMVMLK